MTSQDLCILEAIPPLGVPGGEVRLRCHGFRPGLPSSSGAFLGEVPASIVSASEETVVLRLPDSPNALGISLRVGDRSSPLFPFSLASRFAKDLHPVTSPVVASDGSIITTISGRRGEQIPQPLVCIQRSGERRSYGCEIMNPTGLAFGPDGQLYISSRHDGTVLRYADFEHLEVVAEDLGITCGIAFDSKGNLFVGDRAGRICRVDPSGNREDYAVLEPSVSAYHLAIDAEDRLYVTGPTLGMRDAVYRIARGGQVEERWRGFARPQGIAILPDGDLLVAAAYAGRKGVFRLPAAGGPPVQVIAGPMLVGLAAWRNELILADNDSLYSIAFAKGKSQVV